MRKRGSGSKRVREYEGIPSRDDLHKLHESMNTWQECMRNHTKDVDLSKLGKRAWHKELGKIGCVFHIMR